MKDIKKQKPADEHKIPRMAYEFLIAKGFKLRELSKLVRDKTGESDAATFGTLKAVERCCYLIPHSQKAIIDVAVEKGFAFFFSEGKYDFIDAKKYRPTVLFIELLLHRFKAMDAEYLLAFFRSKKGDDFNVKTEDLARRIRELSNSWNDEIVRLTGMNSGGLIDEESIVLGILEKACTGLETGQDKPKQDLRTETTIAQKEAGSATQGDFMWNDDDDDN